MRFIADFLSTREADDLFAWLEDGLNVHWVREEFRIFGRSVMAPRQLAWFGDSGLNYRYTQVDHLAKGWPLPLDRLRSKLQTVSGQTFNFVLLNRYADGSEHMGWHRDDEHGCTGDIASLSLGGRRRFCLEEVNSAGAKVNRRNIELSSGSLLVFDGRQRHCLRATKKPVTTRINLTFRCLYP